jgi:ribonuclease J
MRGQLNRTIVSRLQKLLFERTGRRPVIIPMVTILNGDAKNRQPNDRYVAKRHHNRNNAHQGQDGERRSTNNHQHHCRNRYHEQKHQQPAAAAEK